MEDQTDERISDALNEANRRREYYKGYEFEKPKVAIKTITMRGEVVMVFSNTMYVPDNYQMINGDSRGTRTTRGLSE